jgi:group I intron endonuclease
MVCGIYKIVNKVNGRYYVGSSKDILGARWHQHQRELNHRTHHNSHLTYAWHLYGKNNFEIVVIEEVEESRLHDVEQRYLDECSKCPEMAYNLNYASDGGRPSPESIEKIRQKLRGRVFSEDHRRKIGKAMVGREYSKETRAKIGRFSASRRHDNDVRDRISASLTGQKRSVETRERQSAAGIGKHNNSGYNNPKFDHVVRMFVHQTGKQFTGSRFDFINSQGLSAGMVSEMVRGRREVVKGWRIEVPS